MGVPQDPRLWRGRGRGSTGQRKTCVVTWTRTTAQPERRGLEHRQPFNTVLGRPVFACINVTWGHQGNECDLGKVAVCS